jgi:hypothetical protein
MFGDLILVLQLNFKVPHALGVLIHLKSPKSKSPTTIFEFYIKKAQFRCLVI